MVVRKTRASDTASSQAKEIVSNAAVMGLSLIIIATDVVRGISPVSAAATGTLTLSGYELFSIVRNRGKNRSRYGGRWSDKGSVWEG
ncbi:MAG: hypothetical protein KGH65_03135 [Candidatus Micrarchaeota archaeon]|nr:hypothetical protein [Candidatus Micrarchaeota archaeon]